MILSSSLTISPRRLVGCGASVASATAANTSMIRLIQSNWMTLRGLLPKLAPPIITNTRHTMLTVN
jgi:hypothetical protein